ncbi:CGNR zinc finger domain-containing protein [Modestobacter sp. VKM Ac-2985]|uniref:CGNR zinc finger domain-containing protein n=1 Tax=Modestobacter sp. VKM Ac-2985 TaxID=3004139 RepID=UPI0022AB8C67|nr:CGNR zinc finger domain-containing protein [Modestobacter sp. VKM Ac-2985]MCZ2836164.1 CGNR zinc finger domain-containing protein [Modestobacter sp. VKM Ac-2985]
MLFAHDTEMGLASAAALVNTTGDGEERLPDPPALAAFLDEWQFTGSRAGDAAELAAVHELRSVLARVWDADEDGVVAIVNRLLREGNALPQLVRHDDWGYHVHATEPDASVAHRWGVEAAMAVADVVRAGALDRLRRCAASGCDDVLVDLTKNASRRFCDSTCANREHVAAYRARRAADPPM